MDGVRNGFLELLALSGRVIWCQTETVNNNCAGLISDPTVLDPPTDQFHFPLKFNLPASNLSVTHSAADGPPVQSPEEPPVQISVRVR